MTRGSRRRRLAAGALLSTAACVGIAVLPDVVALADSGSATVADSSEGYYTVAAPTDACSSPVGCPALPVQPSIFPADTLHVGVSAGSESYRAYVTPDLTALPAGATAAAGTMTLPVSSDQQAGTVSPGTAKLRGCLATAAAPDGTQGSVAPPPAYDPTLCAPLTYAASANAFRLDLAPFLGAWAGGRAQDGLALVPSPQTGPSDTWHVAFNGRKHSGPHVSSAVTYTVQAASDGLVPAVPEASPVAMPAPAPASLPQLPLPTPAVQLPAGAAPQVAAPTAPAAAPAAQPVAFVEGFRYPAVFLVPLALLAAGWFLVRLFTGDPLPAGVRR